MSAPLYRCNTCGASLSLEQLRGTDCPFCKTAFPHHARAVEHAAVVNQVLAQQMAQANPWMMQGGAPPQVPMQYGGAPPQFPMGAPYANLQGQIEGTVKRSITFALVMTGLIFGLTLAIGVAAWMFAR